MELYDPDALTSAIETSPVHHHLETIDYHHELYDESITFELAEDTAAKVFNPDIDLGSYRFEKITVYNRKPFQYHYSESPVTVFDDYEHGNDAYEMVGDDSNLYMVFDQSHGETRELDTQYGHLDINMPTFDAYVEYTRNVLGEDALPNHELYQDYL